MSDEFLSREEFGAALYDAIHMNSARLQCARQKDMKKAAHYERELQQLLSKHTLNPEDVRRLLAMR